MPREASANSSIHPLIIVGGGIAGAGVAMEASRAGIRAVLIEKGEIGGATSASSLRIIHGGLRYFQSLDVRRVVESMCEQHYWLQAAPEFIKPLPCILPLSAWGLKSKLPMGIAAHAYDFLSSIFCRRYGAARLVSRKEAEVMLPCLEGMVPHGALYWEDALVLDHSSFIGWLIDQARGAGVEVLNGSAVNSIENGPDGIFRVRANCGGDHKLLLARTVVNTAGAWLHTIPVPRRWKVHGWCKAFNLKLKRQFSATHAFGISGGGRYYFFTPRDSYTVLGTWYEPITEHPDEVRISQEDIARFVHSCSAVSPHLRLSVSDVASCEVGVLPMSGCDAHGPKLYKRQRVKSSRGYVEVLSTKYTTFRCQAREVMRHIQEAL